ncbi:MAG: sigma-70 family RNA polymerase sigma factor [Acidobacteriota bacterium]
MGATPKEITQLLVSWGGGDKQALNLLMPMVYGRLRALATSFLRHEKHDHTLQTSALVNEVYMRMVDQSQVSWKDRAHFFAIAGQMMRRILVDHARKQKFEKRGGGVQKISLEGIDRAMDGRTPDLVDLDDALKALSSKDADLAKLVELRYFGGLTKEQIAEVLCISSATVTRRWRMAKAWLYAYLVKGSA